MAYFRCTGEGGSPAPVVVEPFISNLGDIGFNSGHIHTANTKIRMKASFDTWNGYGQAFGARSNNYQSSAMGFFPLFDGLRPCYYRTGREETGSYYNATEDTKQMWYGQPLILECEGNKAEWYIESLPSYKHSLTATGATVNAGIAPLGIFCCNNSTVADGWDAFDPARYMSLYWFEIYESDVLVHRFVPAYNNGQYCLYDEVDEVYVYECHGNYLLVRGSPDIPTT